MQTRLEDPGRETGYQASGLTKNVSTNRLLPFFKNRDSMLQQRELSSGLILISILLVRNHVNPYILSRRLNAWNNVFSLDSPSQSSMNVKITDAQEPSGILDFSVSRSIGLVLCVKSSRWQPCPPGRRTRTDRSRAVTSLTSDLLGCTTGWQLAL